MSLSSVLIAVIGLLVLVNVVLVVRAANQYGDERTEHRSEGASAAAAPPPSAVGEPGAVAPERRT